MSRRRPHPGVWALAVTAFAIGAYPPNRFQDRLT